MPGKKLRFKTTTDASEQQVIEAMQKIASHIKNPTKFRKASKLAIQLIQAGSVKAETSDYFFSILEAAMTSSTSCTDPSIRADFHALFSAAQDASDVSSISLHSTKQFLVIHEFVIKILDLQDMLFFMFSVSIRSKTIS